MNKPLYLIKYVPEYQHAVTIYDGVLFMRPAFKYVEMEGKQGDTEGIIATIQNSRNEEMTFIKGHGYPIYCMYTVFDHDITSDYIHVNREAIKDFKCENGFGVVIPYEKFIQTIPSIYEGFQVKCDFVKYNKEIPSYIDITWLSSDAPRLFYKLDSYSHQQEFRVVYEKSLFKNEHLNKDEIFYMKLNSNFHHYASIIPVSDMNGLNNDLHIRAE